VPRTALAQLLVMTGRAATMMAMAATAHLHLHGY
jgi:hypothetical protein